MYSRTERIAGTLRLNTHVSQCKQQRGVSITDNGLAEVLYEGRKSGLDCVYMSVGLA